MIDPAQVARSASSTCRSSPATRSKGFAAGETIPVTAAKPEPVDIDQFFDMFDEPTRNAIQRNLAGFGNALAGRGPQLNKAIGALRRLRRKRPAGRCATSSRRAPTSAASGGRSRRSRRRSPRSPSSRRSMFVALDRTFAAFARVSRPYIQETISKSPPTLDAVNADLPALRPFLDDSRSFFTALQPGAKALAETSPTIAAALHAGIPALNASPVLNAQLPPTAQALLAFQQAPGVFNGLDLLIDTNKLLGPAIRFIAPAQTICNYLSLAFRNLANASSEGNGLGNWLNVHLLRSRRRARTTRAPRLGAGQRRPATAQPPALQPLSEHRRARPAAASARRATSGTTRARP